MRGERREGVGAGKEEKGSPSSDSVGIDLKNLRGKNREKGNRTTNRRRGGDLSCDKYLLKKGEKRKRKR